MHIIKQLFFRIFFKIIKKLPFLENLYIKVLSGPLKGYKINIQHLNSYLLGVFEDDTVGILESKDENFIVYDAGAHIGYFSMIFAQKSKMVYAFEPMPKNQKAINIHLELNDVKNVKLFPLALSDAKGEVDFSTNVGDNGNTYKKDSLIVNRSKSSEQKITVLTDTIDNLVFNNSGIMPPNLIKIDVEGAEFDVLKGANEVILKYKPVILLSTHDAHIKGISEKCLSFLTEKGYSSKLLIKHMEGMEDFYCSFSK